MDKMELTGRERALLEIIISEVQDALPDVEKTRWILRGWVKSNDLHPEQVEKGYTNGNIRISARDRDFVVQGER